jgi:endonuclease YncB( thermonuclease family)
VQVNLVQWDKFGGRVNGTIFVNGKDFAKMQIDAGLARPYQGEKKQSWCN